MKKNKRIYIKPLIIMMSFIMPIESINTQVKAPEPWHYETMNTASDVSYLSDIEKEIIVEINMVRTNPSEYAERYIKPLLPYYEGLYFKHPGQVPVVTAEGKSALLDCLDGLNEAPAVPVLKPSKGLTKAANDLLRDQSKSARLGHTGKDGSNPFERMKRHGQWKQSAAENIDYGNNSARWIVLSLLIDDGVPGRGHRKNLLSEAFGVVGVSYGTHPTYGHMCVMDMAGSFIDK